MTATLRLPRMLGQATSGGLIHDVEGTTLSEALEILFEKEPGLRNHLLDETGSIRQHVAVFVDGFRAGLESPIGEKSRVIVLHAVSGGGRRPV